MGEPFSYIEVNISTAAAGAEGALNLQDWGTWLVLDHKPGDENENDGDIDDDDCDDDGDGPGVGDIDDNVEDLG